MEMHKKKMLPLVLMGLLMLVSLYFAVAGILMHNQAAEEEQKFHELQEDYYSLSKAERDSAPTDSELNDQLVEIQQYPSTLLELKLVGIGRILAGIFVLLLGILIALIMMPMKMAKMLMMAQGKMPGKK